MHRVLSKARRHERSPIRLYSKMKEKFVMKLFSHGSQKGLPQRMKRVHYGLRSRLISVVLPTKEGKGMILTCIVARSKGNRRAVGLIANQSFISLGLVLSVWCWFRECK